MDRARQVESARAWRRIDEPGLKIEVVTNDFDVDPEGASASECQKRGCAECERLNSTESCEACESSDGFCFSE